MSIAGVVLAAGASTRLGEAKQLLTDAHGEPLLRHVARDLLAAGCTPVFIITGADAPHVDDAIGMLDVRIVHNPDWQEGIASSIRTAVRAAEEFQKETGALTGEASRGTTGEASRNTTVHTDAPSATDTAIDALLFATCDMPTVNTAHLRALCAAYVAGAPRVASRYTTSAHDTVTIGIPAVIGAREWQLLMTLEGDRGAKELLRREGTATVELPGGTFDLDTPDDVARWRSTQTRYATKRPLSTDGSASAPSHE